MCEGEEKEDGCGAIPGDGGRAESIIGIKGGKERRRGGGKEKRETDGINRMEDALREEQ